MMRRVVGSCPSQFDYISRCLASVRLRSFNGIQTRWDAPYAIWEAPKGLDAAYPASNHATITCLHKRSSLVRVDKAGRGRRGGGARDEVIMYSGGYDRHYVCSDDASCDQIYLTAELIADCGQEVFGSAHVELRQDCLFLRDPVMRRAAEAYVARGHDLDLPPTRLEMNARAILIGLHLVSRYSNCVTAREIRKHGLSTRQLTAVLDRIEGSLDGEVRVSDLAVEAGLGVRQFFAAFQVSTGTPHMPICLSVGCTVRARG